MEMSMVYSLLQPFIPKLLRRVGGIEGLENLPEHGPLIVASNHVSYLEPALLSLLVIQKTDQTVFSIAKIGVWKLFHALGLAGYIGLIPVDPKNKSASIDLCLAKLHDGFPVLIFPEGHRNFEQVLQKGKTGTARLALLSGVPVIPAGYIGPRGGSVVETVRHLTQYGDQIRIRFGTPLHFSRVPAEQLTYEQLQITTGTIMRAIAELSTMPYPYEKEK